jgi:hypothetical protein
VVDARLSSRHIPGKWGCVEKDIRFGHLAAEQSQRKRAQGETSSVFFPIETLEYVFSTASLPGIQRYNRTLRFGNDGASLASN